MTKDQNLADALVKQVRVELAERDMNQKDLAAAMGIDPSALNRYLKSKRGVSMAVFESMADGLNMELWKLMKLVEDRASKNV